MSTKLCPPSETSASFSTLCQGSIAARWSYGTVGRWTAISGLNTTPDSALSVAARERDVYVLVECGTLEICRDFENWDSAFRGGIDRHGQFSYERVFSHLSRHAKARVYRLRNLQ